MRKTLQILAMILCLGEYAYADGQIIRGIGVSDCLYPKSWEHVPIATEQAEDRAVKDAMAKCSPDNYIRRLHFCSEQMSESLCQGIQFSSCLEFSCIAPDSCE